MGYAAVRDVASFLRRDTTSANPLLNGLHPSVSRAIGFGVSQSGRFLRDFLYLGFNEDTHGRMVFDALMPHVAGTRRMATNVRFGQPGRNPRHPQDPAWQADLFPFTYATLTDPLSGKTDGLLRRCALSVTCPKVMQTDSEHRMVGLARLAAGDGSRKAQPPRPARQCPRLHDRGHAAFRRAH